MNNVVPLKPKSRKEIPQEESTRSPLFLLQVSDNTIHNELLEGRNGWSYSEDGWYFGDRPATNADLLNAGALSIHWQTVTGFAFREEARDYALSQPQRYPLYKEWKTWRVSAVPADGVLVDVLEGFKETGAEAAGDTENFLRSIADITKIHDLIKQFPEVNAVEWLENPHEILFKRSPIEICLTGQGADVIEYLERQLGLRSGAV